MIPYYGEFAIIKIRVLSEIITFFRTKQVIQHIMSRMIYLFINKEETMSHSQSLLLFKY